MPMITAGSQRCAPVVGHPVAALHRDLGKEGQVLELELLAVGLSRDGLQSCRYHIIFILYKSLGLERFVTLAILHLLVGQGDIFNCFLLITKFFHLLFKSFVHLLSAFLFES